jgi:hypothetical protein
VLKKLAREIRILNAKGFIVDGSQGRADKLTEANERLLHRISGVNSTIGAANNIVGETISSLIQLPRQKSASLRCSGT